MSECALHNFLRTVQDPSYIPAGSADTIRGDGQSNGEFFRDDRMGQLATAWGTVNRNATNGAINTGNILKAYFVSDAGSLPWQSEHITRH